jgi:hypothetical protein
MSRMRLIAAAVALGFGLAPARAGSLASFEAGAHASGGGSGIGDDCLADPLLWELGGRLAFYGLAYGGIASWSRMDPLNADLIDMPGMAPREWGDSLLPVIRADADYQWVEGDIGAVSGRIEGGYGPFAVEFKRTQFDEEDPDDQLILTRWHALYRMSLGGGLEVDLGVGQLTLDGNSLLEETSFTVPLLFHPVPGCGLEFRPAWSDSLTEHSLGLILGTKFGSLTAGYRWLRNETDSLEGPYAGLSFHF